MMSIDSRECSTTMMMKTAVTGRNNPSNISNTHKSHVNMLSRPPAQAFSLQQTRGYPKGVTATASRVGRFGKTQESIAKAFRPVNAAANARTNSARHYKLASMDEDEDENEDDERVCDASPSEQILICKNRSKALCVVLFCTCTNCVHQLLDASMLKAWVPMQVRAQMRACVCVRLCVRARTHARVRTLHLACACVHMHACTRMLACSSVCMCMVVSSGVHVLLCGL